MTSQERFCTSFLRAGLAAALLASLGQSAFASPITLVVSGMVATSTVSGAHVGAGTYSIQQLMSAGAAAGSVTSSGETGISLWSLLGGNSSGASDVVTSTPPGDNGKRDSPFLRARYELDRSAIDHFARRDRSILWRDRSFAAVCCVFRN